MAKSANRKTDSAVTPVAGRSSPRSLAQDPSSNVTEHDIASRAYDLYLARDREHGHDVDDWLQAERELRETDGRPRRDEVVAPHEQLRVAGPRRV